MIRSVCQRRSILHRLPSAKRADPERTLEQFVLFSSSCTVCVCVLPLAPPIPPAPRGFAVKGLQVLPCIPQVSLASQPEPQTGSLHQTLPLLHGQRQKLVCVYDNCVLTAGCRADRQSSPNGKHYLWPSSPSQRQGSVYCRQHNSRWYQRACQRSTIIRSHFN